MTLECKDIEVLCYDINPDLCSPKNTTICDLLICCAIFVSVPTPSIYSGKTSMKCVESVISKLRELD